MRLPSKVTPYEISTISKFPHILKYIETQELSPIGLYKKVKHRMDIVEYIEVLDCLFALGKIEYDASKGVLIYVDRDSV